MLLQYLFSLVRSCPTRLDSTEFLHVLEQVLSSSVESDHSGLLNISPLAGLPPDQLLSVLPYVLSISRGPAKMSTGIPLPPTLLKASLPRSVLCASSLFTQSPVSPHPPPLKWRYPFIEPSPFDVGSRAPFAALRASSQAISMLPLPPSLRIVANTLSSISTLLASADPRDTSPRLAEAASQQQALISAFLPYLPYVQPVCPHTSKPVSFRLSEKSQGALLAAAAKVAPKTFSRLPLAILAHYLPDWVLALVSQQLAQPGKDMDQLVLALWADSLLSTTAQSSASTSTSSSSTSSASSSSSSLSSTSNRGKSSLMSQWMQTTGPLIYPSSLGSVSLYHAHGDPTRFQPTGRLPSTITAPPLSQCGRLGHSLPTPLPYFDHNKLVNDLRCYLSTRPGTSSLVRLLHFRATSRFSRLSHSLATCAPHRVSLRPRTLHSSFVNPYAYTPASSSSGVTAPSVLSSFGDSAATRLAARRLRKVKGMLVTNGDRPHQPF